MSKANSTYGVDPWNHAKAQLNSACEEAFGDVVVLGISWFFAQRNLGSFDEVLCKELDGAELS